MALTARKKTPEEKPPSRWRGPLHLLTLFLLAAGLVVGGLGLQEAQRTGELAPENIDAATADRWGLVEQVVPAAELDAAVERCVTSIVEATQKAVRAQKRLMRRWERLSIDEGIQAGIDAMAESVADGEHLERMTAFVNRKRKG